MVRTCSVCRLASPAGLLKVFHTSTPPHCLHPPTCHLHGVRKYRDCGALSSSGQLVALDFRSKIWFVLRLVLLSRLQTGWAGSSESEVRQMEASRGSDGLAGGPPSILLLERHWPRQSGNLLSSQACSFTSDEIYYQGRTHVLDGEKSCSDRLPPQHWGEGLGLCCWGEPTVSLASLLTCCVT